MSLFSCFKRNLSEHRFADDTELQAAVIERFDGKTDFS